MVIEKEKQKQKRKKQSKQVYKASMIPNDCLSTRARIFFLLLLRNQEEKGRKKQVCRHGE